MSREITAAAAGTWTLGDLTVNRVGFGAMRLTRNADGTPGSRERAVAVRTAGALRLTPEELARLNG